MTDPITRTWVEQARCPHCYSEQRRFDKEDARVMLRISRNALRLGRPELERDLRYARLFLLTVGD